MGSPFRVEILNSEGIVYGRDALSIRVPAAFGYLGILAGHAPLIAGLVKGRITLKDASGEIRDFDCEGGGFVEVLNNEVTIVLK